MPNKKTKQEMIVGKDGKPMRARTQMREKALSMLAQDMPRKKIASACQVSITTLYNWMEEPKFKALIEKRREQIAFDVIQSSAKTINSAAQVVMDAIEGGNIEPHRAKLAFDVLKETGSLRTTGTQLGMEQKSSGPSDAGLSIVINLDGDGLKNVKDVTDNVEILESGAD